MHERNTFQPGNPVACNRLSAVRFHYYSDGGELKSNGHLVVLDVAATHVAELLHALAKDRVYIHKSRPLEEYNGNDIASMDDNNTSAFNSRPVEGTNRWSLHSYGVAIDVNPLQNPVIYPHQQEDASGGIVPGKPGTALIRPNAATDPDNNYLNRNIYRARADNSGFYRPGMAESVIDLFAEHGFLTWGGYWNDPLDYQHFEIGSRRFVERLYQADSPNTTNPVNGKALFGEYIAAYKTCLSNATDTVPAQKRSYCVREVTTRYGQ
ncbi:M15 family metallopeptidase (plasmid) [Ralstonia solanacearum]|uniref:M15 family metallopeptidase n=1 Tax=Ralstonia solanacearum TaxID=305 RepID=UPI0032180A90